MKLTLFRYIIHEIWPTFFATLFVAVFIILATRLLSITELIITKGVHVSQVVMMVIYLLPDIVAFALPAASLISVVVAFLRLSADSEIIAMESSGISLYQMLPPVVALSLVGFLIAILVSVFAVPWGNRSFKDLVFQIAESRADLEVREHIFCEPFDNVVFYVGRFSNRDRTMSDVFVADRRDPEVTNTIIAREGRIFFDPEKRIVTLQFIKGTIFVAEKNLRSSRTIEFDTYDLNIGLKDMMAALASRKKRPKELTIKELVDRIKGLPEGTVKRNETMIELLEKFSIPIAVFFMGIIGVPLGAQLWSRGRSAGIAVSLLVFFSYYIFLAGMRSVCETGFLSPSVGVWLPDIFLLICCVYLLRLSARERPSHLLSAVFALQDYVDAKLYLFRRQWRGWIGLRPEPQSVSEVPEYRQLSLLSGLAPAEEAGTAISARRYVSSIRMHKFHSLDCKWAKRISPENRCFFESREEAIRQGHLPCKVCNP